MYMDLAGYSSRLDAAEMRLIGRILGSKSRGSARVNPANRDLTDAANRLVAVHCVDLWDDGTLQGPRATLTPGFAADLGVHLAGDPARWLPAAKRPARDFAESQALVVYETDMGEGWAIDGQAAEDDIYGARDDERRTRPLYYLGTDAQWHGAEPMRMICRFCNGRIDAPDTACLFCCRTHADGDGPLRVGSFAVKVAKATGKGKDIEPRKAIA